jgi:hypothetical protein
MIGPGWMPSRPRPLPRARRGWLSYTLGYRPRPRRPRTQDQPRSPFRSLFDGFDRAPLPMATLRASAWQPRRALGRHLQSWLLARWAWVRPRAVPLAVALAGMIALLAATKYLSALAGGEAPCACATATINE